MTTDRTGHPRRTRAGDRADRHGDAAELIRRARRSADLTCADVAAACGVSETLVRGWEDPESPKRISLGDAMVPALLPAIVRELAACCGMVAVELPAVASSADDAASVASIARETSEAVVASMEAVARGTRTRAQNLAEQREIREALEVLAARLTMLERSEREPIVGVRRAS